MATTFTVFIAFAFGFATATTFTTLYVAQIKFQKFSAIRAIDLSVAKCIFIKARNLAARWTFHFVEFFIITIAITFFTVASKYLFFNVTQIFVHYAELLTNVIDVFFQIAER